MTEKKDPFEEKVKQALDQSVDDLDQQTLANLNRIRQEALGAETAKQRPPWMLWAPAGGMVTAVLVAALWVGNPQVEPTHHLNDMELLSSEDDLELMEDIEFVAWLMEQEEKHAG